MERIEELIRERSHSGLLRRLRPATCRKEGKIFFDSNQWYIDFSSNDYLGLSNHPKIKEATKKIIDELGTSSSASRLLSGDLTIHHRLEEKVAIFKSKEAALVFNSGYQANVSIISALYKNGDAIFCDRLCHASIIDGILLSGARFFRFFHNNTKEPSSR